MAISPVLLLLGAVGLSLGLDLDDLQSLSAPSPSNLYPAGYPLAYPYYLGYGYPSVGLNSGLGLLSSLQLQPYVRLLLSGKASLVPSNVKQLLIAKYPKLAPLVGLDVDGDGKADALAALRPSLAAQPVDLNGDGKADALAALQPSVSAQPVDLDGDGKADALAALRPSLGVQAVDLNGDGKADALAAIQHSLSAQVVLPHPGPLSGRRVVGPPIKVYQHQRNVILPETEQHYVQHSVGPAVETHSIQGSPLPSASLKGQISAYGSRFVFRRKRAVEAEGQPEAAEQADQAVEVPVAPDAAEAESAASADSDAPAAPEQ